MSIPSTRSELRSGEQEPSEAETPRLELRSLGVDFGATRALDAVSVRVAPGEIVGLLGHNGAGKSTLFNVVSGALPATRGDMRIDGALVPPRPSPAEMAARGITVIHQEPALAPNLSVLDNLFLGQEHLLAKGSRHDLARDALARAGAMHLDPKRMVGSLGLGERQLVDLARGMVRGDMKVLMLDEPTAALGRAETESLHALIRHVAAQGVSIVYVSHRLPDILDVCNRILILRAGRLEVDGPASDFDGSRLARALAPDVEFEAFDHRHVDEAPRVAVTGAFSAIEARPGEVVGLFGMAAGRQFELLEQLFGLHGRYSFGMDGSPTTVSSPSSAMRRGIHLVPADREQDGLVSGASAVDTVLLPWYRKLPGRGGWISRGTGEAAYRKARSELNILGPGGNAPIDEFSGGNRQKHLIARWTFVNGPSVLLLAQPTQGVDVGARVDIARAVRAIAANGAAVLVASAEADEISLLCDRAYVVYGERIAPVSRSTSFGGDLVARLLDISETTQKGPAS